MWSVFCQQEHMVAEMNTAECEMNNEMSIHVSPNLVMYIHPTQSDLVYFMFPYIIYREEVLVIGFR